MRKERAVGARSACGTRFLATAMMLARWYPHARACGAHCFSFIFVCVCDPQLKRSDTREEKRKQFSLIRSLSCLHLNKSNKQSLSACILPLRFELVYSYSSLVSVQSIFYTT